MKLTKKQINMIEKSLRKAEMFELKSQNEAGNLSFLIEKFTGVDNRVDHLQGDGFGVTPIINDDTHVPIDILIQSAKNGIDINEEYMLANLSI